MGTSTTLQLKKHYHGKLVIVDIEFGNVILEDEWG